MQELRAKRTLDALAWSTHRRSTSAATARSRARRRRPRPRRRRRAAYRPAGVADGVLDEDSLEIDESLLTGEADAINKVPATRCCPAAPSSPAAAVCGHQGRRRELRGQARRGGQAVHAGQLAAAQRLNRIVSRHGILVPVGLAASSQLSATTRAGRTRSSPPSPASSGWCRRARPAHQRGLRRRGRPAEQAALPRSGAAGDRGAGPRRRAVRRQDRHDHRGQPGARRGGAARRRDGDATRHARWPTPHTVEDSRPPSMAELDPDPNATLLAVKEHFGGHAPAGARPDGCRSPRPASGARWPSATTAVWVLGAPEFVLGDAFAATCSPRSRSRPRPGAASCCSPRRLGAPRRPSCRPPRSPSCCWRTSSAPTRRRRSSTSPTRASP